MARNNHRTTLPQSRPLGVPAPSEREPGTSCTIHPTARKPQDFGRFSSPLRKFRRVYISPSTRLPGNRNIAGDFHCPYGTLNVLLFSFKLYYAIVIPQTPGVGICGISVFTTCLICTGGCVRLVCCLPFGPAGGLRYCRRLQWQTVGCPLRRISPNQFLQVLRC